MKSILTTIFLFVAVLIHAQVVNISLSPNVGVPRAYVTISGSGFSSDPFDMTVLFGGVEAFVVESNPNKLLVEVPSDAPVGTTEVTVSGNGITSFSSGVNFTVLYENIESSWEDYREVDFDLNVSVVNSMGTADIDRDGDIDLVYDNGNILNIATVENGVIDFKETISTGRTTGTSSMILDIEMVDFNKDGFTDIVAGGSRLGWFENNGDGTWSNENIIDDAASSYEIRIFDANGDQDFDIIVDNGSDISLYENNGSGSFTSTASVSTSLGFPFDWDEDGDVDMITFGVDAMSSNEAIMLLENDGPGTSFTETTLVTTGLSDIDFVYVGDLNDDGLQDIIYSTDNGSASSLGYILNEGASFATEVSIFNEGTFATQKIKLGDFDGNGLVDIARTKKNLGGGIFEIFYGGIDPTLTYLREQLDSSIGGFDVELVDIENDGDLDILQESSRTGGYYPLYINALIGDEILSFSFTEQITPTEIDVDAATVSLEVSPSADITSLVPTIEISRGATISPESGVPQDFSDDVIYTVTGEDGIPKEWTVTVIQDNVAPVITLSPSNAQTLPLGGSPVTISATITDSRLSEVTFHVRALTEENFTSSILTGESDVYSAQIQEADLNGVGVEYFFEAEDEVGNTATSDKQTIAVEFPSTGESSPLIESIQRFGRSVDKYQVISIPYTFSATNNRVDVIFDEYGGNPDNRTWRMVRFDNGQAELVNLTGSYQIQPGEAYFFIAEEEKQVRVGQAQTNTSDPFTLSLKAGWNLVGNPYEMDIDWNSVLANNAATNTVRALRILDSNNPQSWPESTVLTTFEGAFVQADQDIDLEITYQDVVSSGGRISGGAVSRDLPEWYLPISLIQDGNIRKGGIGMDAEAELSLDKFDELALPRWLEFLEIGFLHPGEKFDKYNQDVIPSTTSNIWEFQVSSSQEGVSELNWGDVGVTVPNLKLLDVQNGRVVDMTKQSSYSFELSGTANFKMLYSTNSDDSFEFEELSTLEAYPNPFTDSFKVPFRFPNTGSNYSVRVDLIDLSGRVVLNGDERVISGGSFEYELKKPNALKTGVYLYQVRIESDGVSKIYTKRIKVQ